MTSWSLEQMDITRCCFLPWGLIPSLYCSHLRLFVGLSIFNLKPCSFGLRSGDWHDFISLSWNTCGLLLLLGHYPFVLCSSISVAAFSWVGDIGLYTLESIFLLLSAVTSETLVSWFLLVGIHAQTITLPPPYLTNNVWYVLDHELFRFHHQLSFHLSKYFFFQTCAGLF